MRPTTAFDDNVFDINALLHPGTLFDHPGDVVSHPSLSLSEKRAILASWASDASAIASHPALRANGSEDRQMHAKSELPMDMSRCPGCKKRLMAMTDRTGRTQLVCLKCDNVDPMKTDAAKWANSSLASSAR